MTTIKYQRNMKSLLPTSTSLSVNISTRRGFTLIELLVVITILSVLAVIAFAAFRGLTARGNNARIQSDLKSIADAYEVKRSAPGVSSYGGLALAVDDFSGGTIPVNPISANRYCIKQGAAAVANPTSAADLGIACAGAWGGAAVSTTALTGTTEFFKICAVDNAGTGIFCVGSKQ